MNAVTRKILIQPVYIGLALIGGLLSAWRVFLAVNRTNYRPRCDTITVHHALTFNFGLKQKYEIEEAAQVMNSEMPAPHDEPDLTKPPCLECGATTQKEAETKCICSGDKDNCHGCDLWPD